MRVLIWKGYGIIQVYDYNVPNGLDRLKKHVCEILESGYPEEDIKQVKSGRTAAEVVNIVHDITRGDDSFEEFSIAWVEEI